jgi:hypothetical protein
MFESISRSWELVKASASVLKSDKELLIFPLISALALLVVTATFFFPLLGTGYFEGRKELGASGYILLFIFYLVQYFLIIYFNSALVGAALIRIRGEDPTVRDGLAIASAHLGSIFGYALISATVGLILRWFSERGSLGRLAASFLGLAWGLATFLAVPALVAEDLGPWQAISRSTSLLKKTWGEQIVGNFSIGAIFLLIFLFVLVLGAAAIALSGSGSLAMALIIILVLVMLGLGLISSALHGIFAAAVYSYTTTGQLGGFFSDDLIRGAFRERQGLL